MKNESGNLHELFRSMLSQILRPRLWVIVDDGSTDDSLSIAAKLASQHNWIRVVTRDVHTRERNWLGYGGVVSFGIQSGLQICTDLTMNPAFIAVLDADTVVEADYFERLVSDLVRNPRAVIATGMIHEIFNSGGRSRGLPRGCARVYKKSFLDEITGFPEAPSPDTILDIKARKRNYDIIIDDGARGRTHESSVSRDANGFGCLGKSRYYLGLDILSMLLTTLLLSAACGARMGHSFFDAYTEEVRSRSPRIDDPEIREHFSRSWRRLFLSRKTVAGILSLLKYGPVIRD